MVVKKYIQGNKNYTIIFILKTKIEWISARVEIVQKDFSVA